MLITVDTQDQKIRTIGKLEAHLGDGVLHRAFTTILVNKKKEVLMTQRSLKKPLWPTFWDGSVSSHPEDEQDWEIACSKRAQFELGIKTKNYQHLFSYQYHIKWSELFSEFEVNHILWCQYDGEIKPNPEEVSAYKWLSWKRITGWIEKKPDIMAPWWIMAVEKINSQKKFKKLFSYV